MLKYFEKVIKFYNDYSLMVSEAKYKSNQFMKKDFNINSWINAWKITKFLENLPRNNSETVTNEGENIGLDREIPRERYISPERRQKLLMTWD